MARTLSDTQLIPATSQGFENDSLNGWTANGNCSLAVSSTYAHSGTYSMAITSTATATTNSYGPSALSLCPGGLVGYLVVWAYSTVSLSVSVGLDVHATSGYVTSYGGNSQTLTPNTWTMLSCTATMPYHNPGSYFLPTAQFVSTSIGQIVYYDDFSLISRRPVISNRSITSSRTIAPFGQLVSVNDQGFENNSLNDWTAGLLCTVAVSNTQAHTGTYSMAVTSTASGTVAAYGPLPTVSPGMQVNMSAWVYSTTALTQVKIDGNVKLNYTYINGFGSTPITLTANTWTQLTLSFTMPDYGNQVQFIAQFASTASGQISYWDDFSMTETRILT
jgi:hypothetical protein